MAEKMTTAEMMREYNRMRLERGDSSVSAPAAGSENPELAQMVALLDEAGSLLEKASYEALTVAGTAEQYAMFTATWAVKYYRAEVKKLLVVRPPLANLLLLQLLVGCAVPRLPPGVEAPSSASLGYLPAGPPRPACARSLSSPPA